MRGRKLSGLALVLFSIAPVIAITAFAGTITNPGRTRPCLREYSKGFRGGPLHMALGPDGDLYSTEALGDRIIRFDPRTHKTTEYPLPHDTMPHDIVAGGDGNLWFDGLTDRLGKLDPRTGAVTFYGGITPGSQPHDLVWSKGKVYVAELMAGRL